MIGFDPDICELCGGFGDCADGDCEDKTQKVKISKHQLFHILEILDYLRENNDLNRADEALYQGLSDIRLGLMLGAR